MRRGLALFVCAALGCDSDVVELTEGPASPAVDYSMLPYGAAKYAATLPLPKGPPLSARYLEGVFPPSWRVGDQWIVEAHVVIQPLGMRLPFEITKVNYVFRVVQEPSEPDGEYRLDIRTVYPPDEQFGIPTRFEHAVNAEGEISATFWARDFSLIEVRDLLRPEAPLEVRSNGPHPFLSLGHYMGGSVRSLPMRAFPSLPPRLENPLVCWEQEGPSRSRWVQTIQPTEWGLVLDLELLTWAREEPYGTDEVRIEWRRGEPWWSLVTTAGRYLEPPSEAGAELVDGRMVYARLLRDPETGDPL